MYICLLIYLLYINHAYMSVVFMLHHVYMSVVFMLHRGYMHYMSIVSMLHHVYMLRNVYCIHAISSIYEVEIVEISLFFGSFYHNFRLNGEFQILIVFLERSCLDVG